MNLVGKAVTFALVGSVVCLLAADIGSSSVQAALPETSDTVQLRTNQSPFKSQTDLVRVEVVVTDERGAPVPGLSRSDFVVLDHGAEKRIDVFEAVEAAEVPLDQRLFTRLDIANNQSPKLSQLVLLVLDDMVIRPYLDRTRELAKEVVARVGGFSTIGVVLTSGTDGVEPTENMQMVLDVIGRIGTPQSKAQRIPDLAGNQVSKPTLVEVHSGDSSGCHLRRLRDVAEMVGTDERARKALVYISPFCGSELRGSATAHPDSPYGIYTEAIDTFSRLNIPFYVLDPRGTLRFQFWHFPTPNITGAEPPTLVTMTRSNNPVYLSQEGIGRLAEATGGVAVTNSDAYDHALSALQTSLRSYYVLGFAPHQPERRRYHPIEVRLTRPGLVARVRPGYMTSGPSRTPARKLDELSALTGGTLPAGTLPLKLAAVVEPSFAKTKRVLAILEVDVEKQVSETVDADRLAGILTAIDVLSQKVTQRIKFERSLSISQDQSGSPLRYHAIIVADVKPGLYQFRVAAHSALGGSGSVYLMVDARSRPDDDLAVSSIVVGSVRPELRPRLAGPLDPRATLPVQPTLARTFSRDDHLSFHVSVLKRPNTQELRASAELLGGTGEVVRRFTLPVSATTILEPLTLTLDLSTVPAGQYSLRLGATSKRSTASQELQFHVR